MAELLYSKAHMSEGNIDLFSQLSKDSGSQLPFSNHRELLTAIDEISVGDIPWHSFMVRYCDEDGLGSDDSRSEHRPKWMSDVHKIFYRDPRRVIHQMLANPDYKDSMDFSPYCAFDNNGVRQYQHLMSGDWAWDQAVSPLLIARFWNSQFLNVGHDSPGSNDAQGNVRSCYFRE
jgi:hypothetical protein